jgi:hypothetical protein
MLPTLLCEEAVGEQAKRARRARVRWRSCFITWGISKYLAKAPSCHGKTNIQHNLTYGYSSLSKKD